MLTSQTELLETGSTAQQMIYAGGCKLFYGYINKVALCLVVLSLLHIAGN
jgi:hypothetical protein